jgi:hypothetical protein
MAFGRGITRRLSLRSRPNWGKKNQETQDTRSDLDALVSLLQRWVDEAFPLEHRSKADLAGLLMIWLHLPQVIFGPRSKYEKIFEKEGSELHRAGRWGDPPVGALREALSRASKRGMRETFLVVATRLAIEQLASAATPQAVDRWRQLADEGLPLSALTAWTASEFSAMQSGGGGGLTEQAHDALALGSQEAKRVGDHDFDTAHLLLALTRQQGTVAVQTLERMGVDVARLRGDLESIIAERAPLQTNTKGRAVTRALSAAIDEVRFGARVTTGHVLLGIMADTEGVAASVLARLELSPDSVRKQVRKSRARER